MKKGKKVIVILLSTVFVLFAVSQIWAKSLTANIEMPAYEVLETYGGVEIRKYEPANYTYVNLDESTYEGASGQGFRKLAGYIFGGNSEQKKIAMTAPVEMEMDDKMTMKFLVPAEYSMEELPTPNNAEVKFVHEPEKVVAAIQFSGFANDDKIEKYKDELTAFLNNQGIDYKGQFSFLGYNSPFDLFNRRNEIVVEVVA